MKAGSTNTWLRPPAKVHIHTSLQLFVSQFEAWFQAAEPKGQVSCGLIWGPEDGNFGPLAASMSLGSASWALSSTGPDGGSPTLLISS